MKKRVVFKNSSNRYLFFQEVLKASGFETWRGLRAHTKIPKSLFEFYRNGTYTIPFDRYFKLNDFLVKEKQDYFNEQIRLIEGNWGPRKGGVTTFKKHKEIFIRGRKLAWRTNKSGLKYNFDINLPLNEELCEFIGAFIGDGFTNKYGSSYLIQFTGDVRLDYEYYNKVIIPIVKSHFGINPYIRKIDNTLRINFHSKMLYRLLTKRFKSPAGKKSYTIKIPKEILKSCQEFITALLRGIYDTDGCIFFDKRLSYRQLYPRVYIKLINKPLIRQIYALLKSFNLNPTITKNEYVIQINGKKYAKKFLKTIGFSNPRHINRVKKGCPELLE